MSVQLAPNEVLIRRFDYATQGFKKKLGTYTTNKSLIVTNKRVIHEAVSRKRGCGMVARREMPLEDAQYVDTAVARTSKPALIVWFVVLAILGAVAFMLPTFGVLPNLEVVFQGVGAGLCLIAVLCLIAYFSSRKAFLLCNISTDHPLYPVMGIAEVADNGHDEKKAKKESKKNRGIRLEIAIHTEVARQLSDELGAVLLEAKSYVPQQDAEDTAVENEENVAENVAEDVAVVEDVTDVEADAVVTEEAVEAVDENAEQ